MFLFAQGVAKRSLDLLGATAALVLLLPLLFVIAVAIKATSPGPILIRQQRHGKDGSILKIYAFRTSAQANAKPGLTSRVTAVGQILRRLGLDELPQLINVLSGALSLVEHWTASHRAARAQGAS